MVRAFGLVVLSLGLFSLAGCGNEGAAPKSKAIEQASNSRTYAEPHPSAIPPTASAPVPAMDAAAAPVVVELSDFGEQTAPRMELLKSVGGISGTGLAGRGEPGGLPQDYGHGPGVGGDKFSHLPENEFQTVKDSPLSTFSIDVDTASYAKTRMYLLEQRTLPPADAVRIEELINYFDYDYAGPADDRPFAVHLETAECPWQPKHRLVRCALQGKKLLGDRPASNLVFLIDVSGSMAPANRLPLVQRSLSQLVRQLGENDHVSIVVYAGAAGQVLAPTSGAQQAEILHAINNLHAGGSTNGGQGIQLAYQLAQQHFLKGGVNRVILCSDGDFNVGVTSTGELIRLAKEKADLGIYLSVLGFGMGNHNDAMMEELSNKANGNYAFIDSDSEARKVFVEQLEGTLVTIAKDVKIQVEFNPAQVAAYRLVGYENRRLANRDFNDDKKDAGDIGAGHRVTALYEIIPPGVESEFSRPAVDLLKYQGAEETAAPKAELTEAARSGELLTLKLRYQPPAGGESTLLTFPLKDSGQRFAAAPQEFQFAAAVASFGMLLRNSKHKGNTSYAAVLETATAVRGADRQGLRSEFLNMVDTARRLTQHEAPPPVPGAVPAATGAWTRPAAFKCGTPDPPRYSSGTPLWVIFAMGLSVGVCLAVVVAFAGRVPSLWHTATFCRQDLSSPGKDFC